MRSTIALLAAVALAGAAAAAPARAAPYHHSERLAARARRGDRAARARLVEEHMGLVRSVALRYRNLGLPLDDLVQEGAIGLLAAIDDYEPDLGTSFSTYAFWRVRAAVTHAITAHGSLVRVPRTVRERRRLVAAAHERLSAPGGAPSTSELAAAVGLPAAAVVEALTPIAVASLESPWPGGRVREEWLADDPASRPEALAVAAEETRALRGALRRLRPRKRTILRRHFGIGGEPETLTAIAADLRLSPERTRTLKDEALRELAAELDPA